MQKIYDEQNTKIFNKDRISVTDLPFLLRLQYGSTRCGFSQPWRQGWRLRATIAEASSTPFS